MKHTCLVNTYILKLKSILNANSRSNHYFYVSGNHFVRTLNYAHKRQKKCVWTINITISIRVENNTSTAQNIRPKKTITSHELTNYHYGPVSVKYISILTYPKYMMLTAYDGSLVDIKRDERCLTTYRCKSTVYCP